MEECLSRLMCLLFLASSVVASERSTRELDSQLRHAASDGNEAACKKLLGQGAALNGRGRNGVTPLCAASEKGRSDVVKLLLGSKAQINAVCDDNSTPLSIASQKGQYEVVKLLLGGKAQVNAVCDDNSTPLSIASQKGHVEIVKLLLGSKAQVDAAMKNGTTPLYAASERGHGEIVKLLLKSKAKANAADDDGTTPLFIASQTGHYEVVKLLLGDKAQVDAVKNDGATPLYVASGRGHGGVVKLLLANKAQVNAARADGVMPLIIASQSGHGDICQLLLDSRAAINMQTKKSKRTALHTAVLHNRFNCSKALLKAGADATVCDVHGDTPLAYAAKQKNRKLCILLSKYGAEIEVSRGSLNKNCEKLAKYVQSVLTSDEKKVSSTGADKQPIRHLVSKGQCVSQYLSASCAKPLYYAEILSTLHTVAQEGDCDKLEMIFGFGVPVDQLNDEGYTALHLAALGGHYKMCSQLLIYGADKSIKTSGGETALQIAKRIGNKKIVELFESADS